MDTKKCNRCLLVKSVNEFSKDCGKNKNYYRSKCKPCMVDYYRERCKKNPEIVVRSNIAAQKRKLRDPIRYHVTEKISTWRKNTKNSNLTTDNLIELYNQQSGICYYTGEKLHVLHSTNPGSQLFQSGCLSLDKKNPLEGYNIENVVWCSYFINTTKGQRTESEFYDMCRNILSLSGSRAEFSGSL